LRPTNYSWRVDETYIRVKGAWKYFYRAVDAEGNTLDFWLSAKRDAKAANSPRLRGDEYNPEGSGQRGQEGRCPGTDLLHSSNLRSCCITHFFYPRSL
jgi:hypothetical protein